MWILIIVALLAPGHWKVEKIGEYLTRSECVEAGAEHQDEHAIVFCDAEPRA